MHLDAQVTVTCTDTDKSMPGTVVRMRGDWADVSVGEMVISLRRTKPRLWVGTRAGMEFTVKSG